MIEFFFSPQFLLGLGAGLVVGAFVGVGLGRRSSTANRYYDAVHARYDERLRALRAEIQDLRDQLRK